MCFSLYWAAHSHDGRCSSYCMGSRIIIIEHMVFVVWAAHYHNGTYGSCCMGRKLSWWTYVSCCIWTCIILMEHMVFCCQRPLIIMMEHIVQYLWGSALSWCNIWFLFYWAVHNHERSCCSCSIGTRMIVIEHMVLVGWVYSLSRWNICCFFCFMGPLIIMMHYMQLIFWGRLLSRWNILFLLFEALYYDDRHIVLVVCGLASSWWNTWFLLSGAIFYGFCMGTRMMEYMVLVRAHVLSWCNIWFLLGTVHHNDCKYGSYCIGSCIIMIAHFLKGGARGVMFLS